MKLNLINKIIVSLILTILLPSVAQATQIKCPPAELIKTQFGDKMNEVTRIEINKFVIKSWDSVTDEENHRWTIEIFADTADDYDFNQAWQNARNDLANSVYRPYQSYTDSEEAYCRYIDQNQSDSNVMALYQQ